MTSEPVTVAVVGTGLMGSSIAMAAARSGSAVRGFDRDADVLGAAASRAGFEAAGSLEACVRGSDVAVVCTPIDAIARTVSACLDAGAKIVTDVGSVKAKVLVEVEAVAASPGRSRFVGGHPMGGSERGGPDGASASLVEGVAWVLTPATWSDPGAVEWLQGYVARLGAHPVRMDAERHDRLVALVSHLPQVVSSTLMEMISAGDSVDPEALLLAGSGFRDITRLAGSDPELWTAILRVNREEVLQAIDRYLDRLASLRDLIEAEAQDEVHDVLAEAKRARAALGAKPQVRAGMAVLQIPVPDRPGVLAELTAALGTADVNIEDLEIVHSPGGSSGVVHLTVLADRADAAVEVLSARGFQPVRVA